MGDNDLLMRMQSRLYSTSLPVPEDDIARTVTTTDPSSIWGKSDLTSITCHSMSGKPFLPILSEVVGAVDEYLIVKRLRCKVFLWMERISKCSEKYHEYKFTYSMDKE